MNATMKMEAGLSLRQSAAESAREVGQYVTLMWRTLFSSNVSMAVMVAAAVAMMAAILILPDGSALERSITRIALGGSPWALVWAVRLTATEITKGGEL